MCSNTAYCVPRQSYLTLDLQKLHSTDKSVGFTLSQATKALRESRGIALLYF